MLSRRFLARFAIVTMLLSPSFQAMAAEGEPNAIFLVAKRELRDRNFRETVVLVTHPRQGGPWGVIINRPLTQPLSEVFTDHESLKNRKEVLFYGGPVAREGLVFLVRSPKPPPRAVRVLRDVYFTGDTEFIDSLLKRPDPLRGLRVYAGYSGWAPGQLQSELALGGWLVAPADAETVFDRVPDRIWPELIERATARQTRYPILRGSPVNSIAQYSPPWKSRAGPAGSSLPPSPAAYVSALSSGR